MRVCRHDKAVILVGPIRLGGGRYDTNYLEIKKIISKFLAPIIQVIRFRMDLTLIKLPLKKKLKKVN